jgi:hypothetical protein
MSFRSKCTWAIAFGCVLIACEDPSPPGAPGAKASSRVPDAPHTTPDRAPSAPAPSFDPTVPYSLELGRGGGRSGLETIHVDPSGAVTVHRNPSQRGDVGWERGTLALSQAQRLELTESLHRQQLLTLGGHYSAGIADGTQWVLRIVRGEEEHVIYCDNRCPEGVGRFATELDRLLASAGLGDVSWAAVRGGAHDDRLWDAVRRTAEPAEE